MDSPSKRPGRRPVEEVTEAQLRLLREVRDFLVQRGIPPTMKELAQRLGISSSTAHEQVGQLVRKGYLRREPGKARGLFLAREPERELMELVGVPLLGMVAAGIPLFATENILGEVMVERRLVASGRHFALRVVGESMRDASIRDGDMVIVRQQPIAENGDIVVAILGSEATLKRLSIREAQIELRPAHPDYQPIPIGPEDDLRIVGKVVAVRRGTGG